MQARVSPFNRSVPGMGTWGKRFCCAKVTKLPRMMFRWEPGYIDINEKIYCSLRIKKTKNISCKQLNFPLVNKADFSLIWTRWPLVLLC